MLRTPARSIAAFFTAVLVLAPSSFAFDTPLSDSAVRESYFLGQRHDESVALLMSKYTKSLPAPKTGPHISSVSFYTPFAQLVQTANQHLGNYSAQQAQLDHRDKAEIVRIIVEIQLTPSYGAFIIHPANSRSISSDGFEQRSPDFWRDSQVLFLDDNKEREPSYARGQPNYMCSDNGGCILTGATLAFEFPAADFDSDSAEIDVTPPEGDVVSVNFHLNSLR
jgi:hypothetical protein